MHKHLSRVEAREGYIPVKGARLYYREIGSGQPILVLHGGPDFSHTYLLPELDRLSDAYRLIYYDQRGRGRSAADVRAEDVSMESEMQDLEDVRQFFHLESTALLGHSWGGLLSMEYALRHAERVSRLILMNTAPVSRDDYLLFRERRLENAATDVRRLREIAATEPYKEGSLEGDADYYRFHFRSTLQQPERLEKVVRRLRVDFDAEGILQAREIEARLMQETWQSSEYNLLPRLAQLNIPTLIIHGEHDLVPMECVEHISQALPHARLVSMKDAGHFSYIDSPDAVRQEIDGFFREN